MRVSGKIGLALTIATVPGAVMAAQADRLGAPPEIATERLLPREAKLAPDFRVRADLRATAASLNPLADPSGPLQHRFASSMIDYYPLAGSGFRFSAGMRFFQVTNFARDGERATAGMLYTPRFVGSGAMVRTGFNRRTPAATLGYTRDIKNARFGVEVGSLIGPANARLPRALERLSNRGRGGVNPIANVVVGLRF